MALTERSRSALYLGLSDLIEEQAVQEMLSYFPARDVEEPVTRDHLQAEMAGLRTEMAEFRAEMRTEMADLRTEMAEFRTEMRAEMAEFRTDMRAEMAEFRTEMRAEMAEFRTEVERNLRALQSWTIGTGISLGGLIIATNALLS